MKILFHAAVDPCLAQGHAAHVRHLVDALGRRGHRLDVVGLDQGGGVAWDNSAGAVLRLRRPSIPWIGHFWVQLSAARQLRRILREERPDVVLVRCEVLSFAPLLLPRGTPLLVESNASLVGHQEGSRSLRARLVALVEGRVLARAARIGIVATELAALHARHHRIPAEKLFHVPNGAFVPDLIAPAEALAVRAGQRAASDDFVLGLAGSASRRIEFRWLLDALRQVPKAVLWVMGGGELWSDWQRQVERERLSARVRFLGPLPEEEAARYLQAAQLVVAPYGPGKIAALGGHPLKVLFGLACNRPVLASGVGDDPPLEELGAGRYVDAAPRGWIAAVEAEHALWRDAGRPLAEWPWSGEGAGRRWVRAHRSWEHTARIWEDELVRAPRTHRR